MIAANATRNGAGREHAKPLAEPDLAIVITSMNEAHWVRACLPTVLARTAAVDVDIVVSDIESEDGLEEMLAERFPGVRVVAARNRGFAHANNRALETCQARYALLLNPDTEVVDGDFADLVAFMDARPEIGVLGVRQLTPEGHVYPTMRRFANVRRAVGEALATERWPVARGALGQRVLDPASYEREQNCDWTIGSFMLIRREALLAAGLLDERYYLYAEEEDLCLRIRNAGWEVVHSPRMTIIHHVGKAGVNVKLRSQRAFARRQYAEKHFSPLRRRLFLAVTAAHYAIRVNAPGVPGEKRRAARACARALLGLDPPPFGEPPHAALPQGGRRPD
jgi:GT2 family glycosyltransferase